RRLEAKTRGVTEDKPWVAVVADQEELGRFQDQVLRQLSEVGQRVDVVALDARAPSTAQQLEAAGLVVALVGWNVEAEDTIEAVVSLLREGKIVAIRGIGGFHLAVDARNDAAVHELRLRKGRAQKPFALMSPDMASVEKFCHVKPDESLALQSPQRPITLLRAQSNHDIAPAVAPNNRYLGFMLPYTPLHYLLLKDNFDALVMTSGNFSEEPIATGNEEALERLGEIADYFLLHDREILQRCDDSIVRCVGRETETIRRSRGYVPRPVFLSKPTCRPILACGGELKNTIALSHGRTVFLSQHIGDLHNPAALAFFENSIEHLQKILEITPEILAYDLHPEYLSTKWVLQQEDLPAFGVQHHHAHLVSVMAENGVEEPTIGIILDGTGYGTDGTIWGGEILVGDASSFERLAWLEPVALPGGDAAIRQPWRMALSYLYKTHGRDIFKLKLPFMEQLQQEQLALIVQMIEKKLNVPMTSSCGRLFDAVAALLNIRTEINYEAQAAIELEMAVDEAVQSSYENAISSTKKIGALHIDGLIRALVEDLQKGRPVGKIAACFHNTLAQLFVRVALRARAETEINQVGLSGGVFQNSYFFRYICTRLRRLGFVVLTHKKAPTNDGGLALGQIAVADAQMQ
ncbi:carbamoyltransferase HypF, partial [bacterium]|nr:carbamoyltransferase HypF [bacterium]